MKITKEWLKSQNACKDGYDWFCNQNEFDVIKLINKLIEENHFDYANWLVTSIIKGEQTIKYAIYSAKSVLHIFEEKYPNDDRPRKAIEMAEKYLDGQSNYSLTATAAYAAAAAFATDAADAADATIKSKIINYGIELIEEN